MPIPRAVLAIETSPTYQRLIQSCLEDLGYQVSVTGEALKGLELANQQEFDLVLFTHEPPDMDPLSLQLRFKTKPDTSLCLIATLIAENDIQTAERNGLKDHLVKPFDFETLRKKVEGLIGQALPKT